MRFVKYQRTRRQDNIKYSNQGGKYLHYNEINDICKIENYIDC